MQNSDLDRVIQIADVVHPGFPEAASVLEEKLDFFPKGCFILENEGEAGGYFFSHPWVLYNIPALDCKLPPIPEVMNCYYIHDIALLPQAQTGGMAKQIITQTKQLAKQQGFTQIALVAVNNSQPFWNKMGFMQVDLPSLAPKLATYGGQAHYMIYEDK